MHFIDIVRDKVMLQSNATMRMGCSELNAHLFRNHVIDSPACACGDIYEDAQHYLFVCPRYLV